MSLYKRFFREPEDSFFLFGPRGTGKSTLMKLDHPKAVYIDLLKPEIFRRYQGYPERLYQLLEGDDSVSIVVIDEVQKNPLLLSVVHSVMEEKRGIKFILTGSSSRKLKRSGADLLGGRAMKRTLHPLMAAEMGDDFDFQHALKFGLIPVVLAAKKTQDALEAYVNIYLQEEIYAEGLVRNLEGFARFLEAVSFSHASLINISNIAKECEVKRKTVENYMDILQDLLLAFHIPVFSKRAKRELVKHSKFYLFDSGIFQTLRPRGPMDRPEEIQGAAVEGLVAQHLMAWNDYSNEKYDIGFWRTRSGAEVDFVIYGEKGFWAIEVKQGSKIHSSDLQGLKAFCEDYPIAQPILLYNGMERLKIDGILCLPCESFIKSLIPNAPLF